MCKHRGLFPYPRIRRRSFVPQPGLGTIRRFWREENQPCECDRSSAARQLHSSARRRLAAPDGAAPAVNPAEFVITSFGAVSDEPRSTPHQSRKRLTRPPLVAPLSSRQGRFFRIDLSQAGRKSPCRQRGRPQRLDQHGRLSHQPTRIEGHFQDWLPAYGECVQTSTTSASAAKARSMGADAVLCRVPKPHRRRPNHQES